MRSNRATSSGQMIAEKSSSLLIAPLPNSCRIASGGRSTVLSLVTSVSSSRSRMFAIVTVAPGVFKRVFCDLRNVTIWLRRSASPSEGNAAFRSDVVIMTSSASRPAVSRSLRPVVRESMCCCDAFQIAPITVFASTSLSRS